MEVTEQMKDDLRESVLESDVRQIDLAKEVGCTKIHLNAVLKGRLPMSLPMYRRIEYWFNKLKEDKKDV